VTSPARPKVPRTPPSPLNRKAYDLRDYQGVLWRIHRTVGEHVLAWNQLRTHGPLATMRWEPHPEPRRDQREGVLYAATDLGTAVAEVFQATRLVDTISGTPHATAWQPTRPLRLLDVTEGWALRNGAAAALGAAPRSTCRAWARSIATTWPDLDGLWVTSTMTGHHSVVLWNPADDSFPTAPLFSRPLGDPTLLSILRRIAAKDLNYRIL